MTVPALVDYDSAIETYDPVLGLEVHVELSTATKMFCACPTTFGAPPNTQTCPVCLALPGALPTVNRSAVEYAMTIGLALNCEIAEWCRFARKNYFYPDMPKNFQTSQYDEPIAFNGWIDLEVEGMDGLVRVEIERAHMEEDTGKSLHVGTSGRIHGAEYSLLDYNRAGVPLVEIVTKPIVGTKEHAPAVARAYVAALRDLLRALNVSDVRMDQGSLRCDVNLSLTPAGNPVFGTRTETKNVNSLRSVERAVRYEVSRQAAILDGGGRIKQETRHFEELTGTTRPGRSKEQAEDYRYFPEPDLVPMAPSREDVERLRAALPEMPWLRRGRLQTDWGFTDLEMRDLIAADAVDLVAATVAAGASPGEAKAWMAYLGGKANEAGGAIGDLPITAGQLAAVAALVNAGSLNAKLARQVIDGVLAGEGEPDQVVAARGLAVVSDDSALQQAVDDALAAMPDVAERIRSGKVQAVGAVVGAVMKATRGQADAGRVRTLVFTTLGVEPG